MFIIINVLTCKKIFDYIWVRSVFVEKCIHFFQLNSYIQFHVKMFVAASAIRSLLNCHLLFCALEVYSNRPQSGYVYYTD